MLYCTCIRLRRFDIDNPLQNWINFTYLFRLFTRITSIACQGVWCSLQSAGQRQGFSTAWRNSLWEAHERTNRSSLLPISSFAEQSSKLWVLQSGEMWWSISLSITLWCMPQQRNTQQSRWEWSPQSLKMRQIMTWTLNIHRPYIYTGAQAKGTAPRWEATAVAMSLSPIPALHALPTSRRTGSLAWRQLAPQMCLPRPPSPTPQVRGRAPTSSTGPVPRCAGLLPPQPGAACASLSALCWKHWDYTAAPMGAKKEDSCKQQCGYRATTRSFQPQLPASSSIMELQSKWELGLNSPQKSLHCFYLCL